MSRSIDGALRSRIQVRAATHRGLEKNEFDSAFISQVLGHFDDRERIEIVVAVVQALKEGGELLIIDSVWNPRAEQIHPARKGYVLREIEGHDQPVYKHYFLRHEVTELLSHPEMTIQRHRFATYFWYAQLRKNSR